MDQFILSLEKHIQCISARVSFHVMCSVSKTVGSITGNEFIMQFFIYFNMFNMYNDSLYSITQSCTKPDGCLRILKIFDLFNWTYQGY